MSRGKFSVLKNLIGGYYCVIYNDKRTYGRRLKFYVAPNLPPPVILSKIKKEAEKMYSCPCEVETGTRFSRLSVIIKVYSEKTR